MDRIRPSTKGEVFRRIGRVSVGVVTRHSSPVCSFCRSRIAKLWLEDVNQLREYLCLECGSELNDVVTDLKRGLKHGNV